MKKRPQGFTLLEITVALVLVAGLLALVVPVVMQQLEQVQPVRVARDVRHVKTALQEFRLDTGTFPRYVSQLSNAIGTGDLNIDGRNYTAVEVSRWHGPYLASRLPTGSTSLAQYPTGYDATILNLLYCWDELAGPGTGPCTGHVAVRVMNMVAPQFLAVDHILDDPNSREATNIGADTLYFDRTDGNWRFIATGGIVPEGELGAVYYLALPYR